MIITIIATALIQCVVRTHAGWITGALASTARSPLAARLDILVPSTVPLAGSYGSIRRALPLRYCNTGYMNDACGASRSQKSEPGCPGSRSAHPGGDEVRMDG